MYAYNMILLAIACAHCKRIREIGLAPQRSGGGDQETYDKPLRSAVATDGGWYKTRPITVTTACAVQW